MVPDGRTDERNGRTDGRRQNYIPPTLSGDNKLYWVIMKIIGHIPGKTNFEVDVLSRHCYDDKE